MAAQEPSAVRSGLPFASVAEAFGEESFGGAALPQGWSIVDYPGKRGRSEFAVFAHGRRMASGMTTAQSASRWARLLSATQP